MKKLSTFLFAVLVFSLPLMAVFDSTDLSLTLHSLRVQLKQEYQKISRAQARLTRDYDEQHQRMIDLIKECNELSLVLYSQRQNYTFDLTYALEKVTEQYNEFNRDRRPYDRIAASLDLEIDRYARLLEALRRLPPERSDVNFDIIPDSLRYRNDTLDTYLLLTGLSLNEEIASKGREDAASAPFILDEEGEIDRDSCIFYASQMLKMCADRKALIVADSTHYREAQIRLKESYDYARDRYKILQNRIFVEGQIPWVSILKHPGWYWRMATEDARDKYEFIDNALAPLILFLLIFGLIMGLVYLLCRFVKPLKNLLAPQQKPYVAMLLAILLFALLTTGTPGSIMYVAEDLFVTFLWLLGAILAALLIRVKPERLNSSLRLYLPTIILAFAVIGCRVLFLPNALMNFMFPPALLVFLLWQLVVCLRGGRKAEESDRIISWASLVITATAMIMSVLGYIFMALLVLLWWYFQLAAIHTIATVWNLLSRYRNTRMDRRIAEFKEKHSAGIASNDEYFLFGVTWFYDLISKVVIPMAALGSIPLCLKLALNVFDFTDLYNAMYYSPFVNITDAAGVSSLRLSFQSLLLCIGLLFVFRYLGKAIPSLYLYVRFLMFTRKHKRSTVRNNEINFSLANSIITVITWFIYIVIIFNLLKIPTGWMAMIATGLSAGIGIAMKDILNNFICGIQLMGGRLRVGDWIECDGIRGTVIKITYQSTQIETIDDAIISFLNGDLFSKNFSNLTRNNSYEFLKITVGVAYGTDVQKVRDILVDAMQVMRTKDKYDREIVRPDKGIYVVLGDFGDSSVNIAVKQYILAAERIPYVDKAKEVIYNALNANGITIPFPQLDVHFDPKEN